MTRAILLAILLFSTACAQKSPRSEYHAVAPNSGLTVFERDVAQKNDSLFWCKHHKRFEPIEKSIWCKYHQLAKECVRWPPQ